MFTLPGPIADIAYHNKAAIYGLLFTAAAEATMTIAADPKRLGASIGITSPLLRSAPVEWRLISRTSGWFGPAGKALHERDRVATSLIRDRKFADSLLGGGGFELPVPGFRSSIC